MHALIRGAGTVLTGAFLAAAGAFVALPSTAAQAASLTRVEPASVCAQPTVARPWICFLRYCDAYYCYYDCYPTAFARQQGEKPGKSIRVPKPRSGSPAPQITSP